MSERLRIAQWGTGNIGTRALREVVRHPDLELIGVRVYDPAKTQGDAGDLCGEPSTGVTPTTDSSQIVALGADCVLYMPSAMDVDDVVALLESGTNIVTTCGQLFARGEILADDDRERVRAACERGHASIYATGSSPGFITDSLPFALLSMQRRVDLIEIEEFANLSRRDSPEMLFDLMGFGRPLESYDDTGRPEHLLRAFGPSLGVLMTAAGRPVDEWKAEGDVAAARRDTTILAGEIPAGTVAGQRTVLTGVSGGDEVVRFTPTWFCTEDLDPQWDLRSTGWRARVRGDASMDVEISFPIALDDFAAFTPALTANRPVNAIPLVCAAAPGILSTADLPPITPGRTLRGQL